MFKRILLASFAILLAVSSTTVAVGPPGGAIWADGHAYITVATPSNLPNKGPKDALYVFDNLDGQSPVSESKPGDRNYNGGRWQVHVLAFTSSGLAAHDANGDGVADFELTSWEMVQEHIGLGHLEMLGMGPSFVCPLIR
ncbi:MAG: hypothetical protein P1R58_06910 [bacterium]|nr:hypothetical protein [bacterium]